MFCTVSLNKNDDTFIPRFASSISVKEEMSF